MRISDWSSDVCSSDLRRGCLAYFDETRKSSRPARSPGQSHPPEDLPGAGAGRGGGPAGRAHPGEARYSGLDPVAPLQAADRDGPGDAGTPGHHRSEEHTTELQSLMRISYAVSCLKKKN